MPVTDKISIKEIAIGVGLVIVFALAMLFVLNSYQNEGEKRSAVISEEGEKDPNHIETFVKLLAIDPVKGDATARLEFVPHGKFAKEDGTLTQKLKLYINSATGKQEHDFEKGKRMNPVEAVVSMYDGLVTDYPFDKHSGFLELYFTPAATTSPTPTATPAARTDNTQENPTEPPTAGAKTDGEGAKPAAESKDNADDSDEGEDVSIAVDFYGSVAGFKIEAAKSEESTDDYVGIDMKISRSSTVVFFVVFVMLLMWGVTIAVMFMTLSVFLRGRKIELGMFSFLAALLFAFGTVRNNQPQVPPVGTFSDYISFFWAMVILALCLLAIIFMWLLRPTAK